VGNEYHAKHGRVLDNIPENITTNNLVPSAMASALAQSIFDSYNRSSDDEDYSMPDNVAE
jgi:hypothetical protein